MEDATVLIHRDQLIVGRPAVDVRETMRALHHRGYSARALGDQFGLSDEQADALVAALRDEGLIQVVEAPSFYVVAEGEDLEHGSPFWATTVAGNALAKAPVGAPMPTKGRIRRDIWDAWRQSTTP